MIYSGLAILLFLISLLAVLPAPTNLLWRLKVGVTEFPLVFSFVADAVLIAHIAMTGGVVLADALVIASSLLFISPVLRAGMTGQSLPVVMDEVLGRGEEGVPPFDIGRVFGGFRYKKVNYERMVYKRDGALQLHLDYYRVPGAQRSPCVIVMHGGGWDSGDSQQLPALNSYLVSLGYCVASISYRLAPEHNNPAPAEDVRSVVAYLKEAATRLGIDENKLFLLGRSAGGQVALLAAYTMRDPAVKGVVSFYGPADMVWAWSVPGNPWIMDSRAVLKNYIGSTFEEDSQKFHAASPLEFVSADAPPTLLIHGKCDEMVAWEHSRRLSEKLKGLGVPNVFLSLPWATHACDFTMNGPSGQLSTYAIRRFLNSLSKKE